jgi:hypothetical protein
MYMLVHAQHTDTDTWKAICVERGMPTYASYIRTKACMQVLVYAYTHTHIYIYTHRHIYVHIYMYTNHIHTHIYICNICTYMYVRMYVCMHVCMHVCTHVRMYIIVIRKRKEPDEF